VGYLRIVFDKEMIIMSGAKSYDVTPNIRAIEEAERRRQERIADEKKRIAELVKQAELNKQKLKDKQQQRQAKLQKDLNQIEQQTERELQRHQEKSQDDLQQLDEQIIQQQREIEQQQQQFEALQSQIEALTQLNDEQYLLLSAVEQAMEEVADMGMSEIKFENEGFYIHFKHRQVEQSIEMAMSSETNTEVTLNIEHGFEDGECENIVNDLTHRLSQRGHYFKRIQDNSSTIFTSQQKTIVKNKNQSRQKSKN
jgi:DNA repair exonuclease SbcCD ATPase subunit